ncbi:MAG: hypothetical protein LBH19_00275 [Dysgonamonadaceae bacterium]|jgi:hypothetical protein|nr:hypothetical protein [Dysgonamonadaceae bacterium]
MKRIICFIGLWVVWACEDPVVSPIPSAPVYLELNLAFIDNDLMPVLAAKSITQQRLDIDKLGFGGVLIVHGSGSGGLVDLYAYDLACPHEIDRNVRVIPDNEGKAHCPKCGSVYLTMWGTGWPEKNSLSKYPLRSYLIKQTGEDKFVVVN